MSWNEVIAWYEYHGYSQAAESAATGELRRFGNLARIRFAIRTIEKAKANGLVC